MVTESQAIEIERTLHAVPEPGGNSWQANVSSPSVGQMTGKASAESAGYVVMWNTHTLDMRRFNKNAVRSKIMEVFPEDYPAISMRGRPCWTGVQPTADPWVGRYKCPLHPDQEERAEYNDKGYPLCNRTQIPNEMEAQKHLRSKHPSVWRMMQEEIESDERKSQAEDRRLSQQNMLIQQQILAKLTGVDIDMPKTLLETFRPDPEPEPEPEPDEPEVRASFGERMREFRRKGPKAE